MQFLSRRPCKRTAQVSALLQVLAGKSPGTKRVAQLQAMGGLMVTAALQSVKCPAFMTSTVLRLYCPIPPLTLCMGYLTPRVWHDHYCRSCEVSACCFDFLV